MSTARRDLRTSGDLVMAPRVPHGLAAAVEGLTREVIRHRPEDIYVFAAQHFEELLKLRDEYGAVTNLPGKSTNTAALREMNQSLKKKSGGAEKIVAKPSREKGGGGWSMNETARVLERHRSIFGDKGKKVSPDEVRALAGNEKENKSRRCKDDVEKLSHAAITHKRRGSNERFVRRRIPTKDQEQSLDNKSKSDSNGNPKIISQIPTLNQSGGLLAKDIKSELRKNRNSSRDGRSIRERAERKNSERVELASRQSGATKKTSMRSSHERSLDKLNKVVDEEHGGKISTDNQKQKTEDRGWTKSFSNMPRTLSMDRVREYVVEKFRGSESWEDLRSTNYVDRVQEVIDEASPTILRRVKELSIRSAGRRSRGYESVDESTSTSTRSDKSNQTDDVRSRSAMSASRRSRRSRRRSKSKSKSKTSGADSLEGIETLASETEPQVKETKKETGRLKKATPKISPNGLSESDASDYTDGFRKASASSSISLPAVRPPSSKNHSRSVSRSDSDNLVLPPIPPEASRSAKQREELILPSLQVTKEILKGLETPGEDAGVIEDTAEVELNLPDAPTEEIFKDSLNVTPEIAASPRPDSLEPDNIAELKSKLNEINSGSENERVAEPPYDPGVEEAEVNDGVKERLKEIEETEKRIEKILMNEDQESRGENSDGISVEEKLIEIQQAEERLKIILDPSPDVKESGDPEDRDIPKDVIDLGIKDKLMEIEETQKRIEMILDSETQEIQKDTNDHGIKEKLMEIEETEKRIEKILLPADQEIESQKNEVDDGMGEKLMEIEETEKRIERILDSEPQEIQEEVKDLGMKEKLMEIEETEKRIEKILHPEGQETQKDEVDDGLKAKLLEIQKTEKRIEEILLPEPPKDKDDKPDVGFVEDKLIEIEEAEKRLKNVFDSTSGEEQNHNLILKNSLGQNNSAPKTPFIPEIPSEYVTTANQVETFREEDKPVVTSTSNPEETRKEVAERSGTRAQEAESKIEQFSSGTPDSLGNSYILTEGSPYEIPDSVTTVIIPERQLDTPSSDIIEIVLEDDFADGKALRESPEEESREISLKNILDNFGEVVHQEISPASSSVDVDFIRNLKPSNDVVIQRKDLGLITEEEDKDFPEIDEVVRKPVTPTLHDIAESEEILELEEARNSSSEKSHETEEPNHRSDYEDGKVEAKDASQVRKSGSSESPEPEKPENPEEESQEFANDPRSSGSRKPRSLETIGPEVTSPTTMAFGYLQQNVTDSATTESTDEVKETTISDDGGNTAAESSVTSPSCGEEIGVRNSESSNEVKETTISDQPAEEIGKNLFSLVPHCHGTMPHVPELNLDSLQDITVSSFQLSDDATAEDDSEAGQPQSENDASNTTVTDEARESQEHEPVYEELIVKEKVLVKEDPCTKVTAYVTEPDTDQKITLLQDMGIKENTDTFRPQGTGILEPEKVTEDATAEKSQDMISDADEKVPEEKPEEELRKVTEDVVGEEKLEQVQKVVAEDVDKKVPEKDSQELNEEVVVERLDEKVTNEEPQEEHKEVVEDVDKKVPEENPEELREEVIKLDVDKIVPEEEIEEVHEEIAKNVIDKVPENKPEEVVERLLQEEPEKVEDVAVKVPEKISEEEVEELPEDIDEKVAKTSVETNPEEKIEDGVEKVPEVLHENEGGYPVVTEPEDKLEKPITQVPEDGVEKESEDPSEEIRDKKAEDSAKKELEEVTSRSVISELETVSLNDFKELEASVLEECGKDVIAEYVEAEKNLQSNSPAEFFIPEVDYAVESSNSGMRVLPEVTTEVIKPCETKSSMTSVKEDDLVHTNPQPPKAEVVTNDLDDDLNHLEKTEYHIYVPEMAPSEECSSTESSTFNSAATKIQAGVRGFLTRRRLQSAQRRSSTLDSVPSIQDSLAADGLHLEPIEEVGLSQAATTIQSSYRGYKARQRLRREDAVQKTTMSVENAFCGNGLQHTGEFHDCLPLPPHHWPPISHDDPDIDVSVTNEEGKSDFDARSASQENREWISEPETTTTKEESVDDDSTLGLLVEKYPYSHQGLNLVVISGNEAVLQSQYLNFITSIEEVNNETDSIPPGTHSSKIIDGFSTLKSNAGIESLPLDNPGSDISAQESSISLREPLAVPGSPIGLVIEEISKTDEDISLPPGDVTSMSTANDVKTSGTNLDNDEVSEAPEDSLELPGLSLEMKPQALVTSTSPGTQRYGSESGKSKDVIEETIDVAHDASLGTMSFSMNVDDMLGLGAESEQHSSKMKPIFEVTVTPRDLLKLTNRSQGSQASGDRVESPVTMMQIVPKSVEEKSDRSEDGRDMNRRKTVDEEEEEEDNQTVKEIDSEMKKIPKENSSSDDSNDRTSGTFSIEKN